MRGGGEVGEEESVSESDGRGKGGQTFLVCWDEDG